MYNHNLELLEKNYYYLWKHITSDEFFCDEKASVVFAKNGEPAVCYHSDNGDVWLNSRYNPSKEASIFMEEHVKIDENSLACFFGLSNGMFAQEIRKNSKYNSRILIYEPSIDIFMAMMKSVDLAWLIEDPEILLIIEGISGDELNHFLFLNLENFNRYTNKYLFLPKYQALFPESADTFVTAIKEAIIQVQTRINTDTGFSGRMLRNELMNLRYLKGCRSATNMVGVYPEDMPAVLVAAGPSLKKNIHLLKQAKGKALIAVVDRSLQAVLEAGVTPDMMFAIDYLKDPALMDFENVGEIPFVVDPGVHFRILDTVKPKNLIFGGADDMLYADLFLSEGEEMWRLDSGGSVATMAIASLIAWGFKKIILLGQDLAMTGNVEHFGETQGEFDEKKPTMSYVEGIEEEKVLTRADFLSYIRWIERIAYSFKEVKIIDATEGGARKKNTVVMTFQEVLDDEMGKEFDVKRYLDDVPRLFTERVDEKLQSCLDSLQSNMKNMKKRLKEGISSCRNGIRQLESKAPQYQELKKLSDSIGKLDEYLLDQKEFTLLNKLTAKEGYDFSEDIFKEAEDDKSEAARMFKKSLTYYEAVMGKIPVLSKMIEEALEHLEQEL